MTGDNGGNVARAEILPLLGVVRKSGSDILALCPAHPDGQKHNMKGGHSLVLHESGVLRCYAGCAFGDVIKALRERGGQRAQPQQRRDEPSRDFRTPPTRVYEYRHIHTGDLIAVKGRFESPNPDGGKPNKTFLWRLPNGTFKDGLGGELRLEDMPLYHGADALPATGRIWFVEGESACDALIARNEIAVCGAWGASQRSFGDSFEALRGKSVYLWPDNDQQGREYMAAVKIALREVAERVYLVNAPVPPKGDAVEFFQSGQTIAGLLGGTLIETSVDVLAEDHYRVRIPTEAGPATFEFEDVYKRGARSMEAELTVSFRSHEPYGQRIDILSQSAREGLVRLLNSQFGKDVSWVTVVSTAYARLKDAHAEVVAGAAAEMAGDETPSSVPFLVDPYVIAKSGTILFGAPGDGKSWTAMLMAVSVDAGLSGLFEIPRAAPVLYINLERTRDSMSRRLARVNMALGLTGTRPIYFLNRRGRSLVDVLPSVKAAIATHGIEFVVLDSLSRAGAGDLNSNETGNRIMDILNSLGVAWLALAHTARQQPGQKADPHTYGSIMQDAAADLVFGILSEKSADGLTLGVGLQAQKGNDVGAIPLHEWAYIFDRDYGLKEVRTAYSGEFVTVDARKKVSVPTEIAEFIIRNGASTAAQVSAALGRDASYVSKVLRSKRFVFVRTEGSERFYGIPVESGNESGNPTLTYPTREESKVGNTYSIGKPDYLTTRQDDQTSEFRCFNCGVGAVRWSDTDTPRPVCERHAG